MVAMEPFSLEDDELRRVAMAANGLEQARRHETARAIFFGELPSKTDRLYRSLRNSYVRADVRPVGRMGLCYPSVLDSHLRNEEREIRRIIAERLTETTGAINYIIELRFARVGQDEWGHLHVTLKRPWVPEPRQT